MSCIVTTTWGPWGEMRSYGRPEQRNSGNKLAEGTRKQRYTVKNERGLRKQLKKIRK